MSKGDVRLNITFTSDGKLLKVKDEGANEKPPVVIGGKIRRKRRKAAKKGKLHPEDVN